MAREGQDQPLEELMKTTANMELYFKSIQAGQQSSKPVELEKAQGQAKLQGDIRFLFCTASAAICPSRLTAVFRSLPLNKLEGYPGCCQKRSADCLAVDCLQKIQCGTDRSLFFQYQQ